MRPWGSRERSIFPCSGRLGLEGTPLHKQPEGLREPFELPHPSGPRLYSSTWPEIGKHF